MATGGGGGGLPPRTAARRVSFLFRRSEAAGHSAGVNALLLSGDEQRLWTGSRDSIITCWDATAAPRPALQHEHAGHIDWVNDLALVNDVLVSCSSDKTLRLWNPNSPEPALGCLTGHSDYVTSLAASATGSTLASGSLRGEVLLWDLTALRRIMTTGAADQSYGASPAEVPRDSVYALGMNADGTLLASGSTEASVSLVDVRTGQSVMQLKGHTDNIRALQLDGDGKHLLTASSDHTIRYWDLGQQRCTQTLAVHTDSVWALAASPSLQTVYSGGRDGCIYRTRLGTRVSELLACEQQPVLRLAVGRDEDFLWASTTSPTVHKWAVGSSCGGGGGNGAGSGAAEAAAGLPVTPRSPLGGGGTGSIGGSCFIASPSAAMRARLAFDLHGTRPPPQQLQPVAATPGLPPIQHVAVLTDRRHVLTQDAEGTVLMWDVSTGAVVRDYGQNDLKEVEQALFQPFHSVSAWFAPEVKLGSLAGSMELPGCFGAEIYAQDLGDEQAPIDLKVNFGEQMLLALFRQWGEQQRAAEQRLQQGGAAAHANSSGPAAALPGSSSGRGREEEGGGAEEAAEQTAGEDNNMPDADGTGEPGGASAAAAGGAFASRFSFQGGLAPVVMVSGSGSVVPWRCPIDSFTGDEDVPQWVADCVLMGHYPLSRELKMAFQLLPLPGSGLPSLLQSKLNAPRVLRVNKVADYVRRKMEDHGILLREEPLFWDPAKGGRWQAEQQEAAAADAAAAAGGVHQLQPVAGPGGFPSLNGAGRRQPADHLCWPHRALGLQSGSSAAVDLAPLR